MGLGEGLGAIWSRDRGGYPLILRAPCNARAPLTGGVPRGTG